MSKAVKPLESKTKTGTKTRTLPKSKKEVKVKELGMSAEDQKRVMKMKADLWDLMYRIGHMKTYVGTYNANVSYELIDGELDSFSSEVPKYFNPFKTFSLDVTIDGTKVSINPGSERYVLDLITEKLDEIDTAVKAEEAKVSARQAVIEKVKAKLSSEEFELLKLR